MTKITDLPRDMLEEVLIRVPVTSSLRGFRSACKKFNTLCKDRRFITKHLAQAKNEFLAIMIMDYTIYLMSISLNGIHLDENNTESVMQRKGTLVSLNDLGQVDVSTVIHCDGLVLCVTEDINSRLVVWNPYLWQTRWIKPRSTYRGCDTYAFGYETKKKSGRRCHKVLRFMGDVEFEIYNFKSNSWKVLFVDADWDIEADQHGVSLKGNTYWFAREKFPMEEEDDLDGVDDLYDFFICFDFTKERFGQHSLPFHACFEEDTVTLSTVGDEQLAVLFQSGETLRMEIWVTSKIEPGEMSWSRLFFVDDMDFMFVRIDRSFFIDQERKVVVVLDTDDDELNPTRNIARIIGEDGYYREVDLGESTENHQCPRGCFYVPSCLQIKQGGKRNRKRKRSLIQ